MSSHEAERRIAERVEAGAYTMTLSMPGLPQLNAAANRHWRIRAREARHWREVVSAGVKASAEGLPESPIQTCALLCERRSSTEPDDDNLVFSFKQIVDAFIELGIVVDDSPEHVGYRRYHWSRVPKKQGMVEITVVDISDAFEGVSLVPD